jgi:hypothetical protein
MLDKSEQITKPLFRVLFNQIKHSLSNVSSATLHRQFCTRAYLWHYGFSVLAFDVSKWHFCALILVDTKFWIIDVWNFVKRSYGIVSKSLIQMLHLVTSLLHYTPRYSNGSVGGHLFRAKATTFKSFLPQFRRPI